MVVPCWYQHRSFEVFILLVGTEPSAPLFEVVWHADGDDGMVIATDCTADTSSLSMLAWMYLKRGSAQRPTIISVTSVCLCLCLSRPCTLSLTQISPRRFARIREKPTSILEWNKRVNACLILIFSMNTNCESMIIIKFMAPVSWALTALWRSSWSPICHQWLLHYSGHWMVATASLRRAPHFGGLWEAAVWSFKMHLPALSETWRLLTQIEACMNSHALGTVYLITMKMASRC